MSTRAQLKSSISKNLADLGKIHFTDIDLNESIQDAYDDITALSQCIVKRITLSWISEQSYYDFRGMGITDYISTIAIFNNVTNWYLRDDLSIRDFDRIRRDWENWTGTPQFWAPVSPSRIAIAAKYTISGATLGAFNSYSFTNAFYIGIGTPLTFDLIYAAVAPTFVSDNESPLIATDMQTLFEFYCTADLLEQDQEYGKAAEYWNRYYENLAEYSERVHKLNRSDLLLRV